MRNEKSLIHWNYFLALESDLANVSRYIEFDESNFSTFSIELSHLLLASASEVDVIAKGICHFLDSKSHPKNILEYQKIIVAKLTKFAEEVVYVPRFNLEFRPWLKWKRDEVPEWWTSYNDVKHHRGERFSEANLRNVLHAMGGLLVSVFYYYTLKFEHYGNLIKADDDVMNLLGANRGFLQLQDAYYPSYLMAE